MNKKNCEVLKPSPADHLLNLARDQFEEIFMSAFHDSGCPKCSLDYAKEEMKALGRALHSVAETVKIEINKVQNKDLPEAHA